MGTKVKTVEEVARGLLLSKVTLTRRKSNGNPYTKTISVIVDWWDNKINKLTSINQIDQEDILQTAVYPIARKKIANFDPSRMINVRFDVVHPTYYYHSTNRLRIRFEWRLNMEEIKKAEADAAKAKERRLQRESKHQKEQRRYATREFASSISRINARSLTIGRGSQIDFDLLDDREFEHFVSIINQLTSSLDLINEAIGHSKSRRVSRGNN